MPCEVTDFLIREPLFLPEEDSCLIQLIFEEPTEQPMGFRICSRETSAETDNVWRTHVTGRARIGIMPPRPKPQTWKREEVWARCSEETDPSTFYDSLVRLGINFGDRFRGIVRIRRRDGEALAEIRLPESLANDTGQYRIHPTLLESCFHLLEAALPEVCGQSIYLRNRTRALHPFRSFLRKSFGATRFCVLFRAQTRRRSAATYGFTTTTTEWWRR